MEMKSIEGDQVNTNQDHLLDQQHYLTTIIINTSTSKDSKSITERTVNCLQRWMIRVILAILCWSLIWSLIGSDALPPNSPTFSLLMLWLTADALGQLCIPLRLPPLFGMMIAGIVLTNLGWINMDQRLSGGLRSTALSIILLRAGLGLDPKVIRELSVTCFKLAFIPCLVEALTIAGTTHLLIGLPFEWGLILGFVLGAVSPAVVVPSMIAIQEKGLGLSKGIPSLVMASASVDDILAITGFDVVLSFAFVTGSSLAWNLAKGPLEALFGLLIGIIIGLFLGYFPSTEEKQSSSPSDQLKNWITICQRFALLMLTGLGVVLISNHLDFGGVGPLAGLVIAFVAAIRWRSRNLDQSMNNGLNIAWTLFEPFLFSLIGAEMKFSAIQFDNVLIATFCFLVALVARCVASFAAVSGTGFTFKEKFFIALAWLPKATVQAAIGSASLDMARAKGDQQAIQHGTLVLTIAIFSILSTAPIGAFLIQLSAPYLLGQSDSSTANETKHGPE